MEQQELAGGKKLSDSFVEDSVPVEPEQPAFGSLVDVAVARASARRWDVTIRRRETDEVLACDVGDLRASSVRQRVVDAALARLGLEAEQGQVLADQLEAYLIHAVDDPSCSGPAAPAAEQIEYEARVDADNPEATGFYAIGEKWQRRLTNFVAAIGEERILGDVDEHEAVTRRLRGTIQVHGETSRFDISTEQYSEQLLRAFIDAAGSRVEFLGSINEVRNAISRNSQPVARRYLTSPGWTADFARFLVPGGFVDADGYHDAVQGDGVPAIDLSGQEKARWLGLRNLDPDELRRVKRHILDDLMGINDRNVVCTMLAAVVLPIALRPAGIAAWPLIWFAGLTGSGKSLLASLAANFHGDFGGASSGRLMSWKSTGMSILATGYSFRDALYVVNDYKRDDVRHSDAVMVLQCYGDRSGRSRLRSDATMNTTKAIRGLMICTGEDFPDSNASGLGRAVVVRVPNPERDYDRVARCLEQCHLYRGWTAAFVADFIRRDRGAEFKTRVDHWQRRYLERIRGRTNDSRIATNHACVATAFELFASFMGDVWGEAEAAAAVASFAEDHLEAMVIAAAGDVEADTPARIFVRILGDQIDFGRVRIGGLGPRIVDDDSREKEKVVGQLTRMPGRTPMCLAELDHDAVIKLCISFAQAAVQGQLRQEGRPELQITVRTLIDQLASLGCLVDPDNQQPIAEGHGGERTKKARIRGQSVNAVWIRAAGAPRGLEQVPVRRFTVNRNAPRRPDAQPHRKPPSDGVGSHDEPSGAHSPRHARQRPPGQGADPPVGGRDISLRLVPTDPAGVDRRR